MSASAKVWTPAEIDVFFAAYVATALWSSLDHEGEPLDANYGPDAFTATWLEDQRNEVLDFISANMADLVGVLPTEAGHLFWLNRNGHGAGFWDRGLGDVGDRLSDASKSYGTVDIVVVDGRLMS